KILVDFNDPVKKGQLLAVIDKKLAKAALDRDQAARDRDQAARKTQIAERDRLKALLRQARNNEERARKLVAINKDYLSETDMDRHMHIFASVDEADIGQIRAARESGRAVKFTVDAYPGHLFEGKIHQVRKNSTTTQNVVTYPVVIEAPNPELKLMPGMTANI